MFPLRTLLTAALPLLVLSTKLEQCSFKTVVHYNSPVLESLQCYNDFTTQMRCTWEEEPHTHMHMPISDGQSCVPDGQGELQSSGKLSRSCIYKMDFSMGSHDLFFNTSCPSKATTYNIAAEGKVLSPTNFSEKKDFGGNRLLSWSSPYPPSSPLTQNLTYQLTYRRHQHDWIVIDNINDTMFVIKSHALLPAYSYEARVRVRGRVGRWSDWSPTVFWITEEEGVINLQCVIMEGGVTCSWQVKKRQAEFLSYHLCGHTKGTSVKCNHCNHHAEHAHSGAFLEYTCSLDSSEPELLTVEIRSLRKVKSFSDPENIQPLRPSKLSVYKQDGVWKLKWTRPDVYELLTLFYQVYFRSNVTKDEVEFNLTEADLSTNVPSSLLPSTSYMAMVRAHPGNVFRGRPSDWSDPVYFTTDPAPWMNTIIYILIAALVALLFILLYNALPACHRRLVLWNISIPSPINSKVLGEMSSKNFLASETNPCKEKTSVFVIQTSDNPIIYKGSISEYPLLKCSNDIDMGLSKSESEWPKSSLFLDGSRMTDKSGVSFLGPYILCREDSLVPSETSDSSVSPLLTFDDDGRYVSELPKDSFPIKGGYVLSPVKNPTSECSTPINNQVSENREAKKSEPPDEDPPAYTSSPVAVSSAIFSYPSGYCLMPNMESVATWVSASVPPPEGYTERMLHEIKGDSTERSYVTLSQRELFQ
ncbi:cytokine receptor common subunit beta isoform X2 [Tachysurus fulvidraco]|uniref:cytokine receptor common subunit beta isoform X2 n=1 Tax=Tachysurus fulvidraco TaxID=1234273 RepID=UPI001FEDA70C|nr:cytokine receptor common subunit beta isoform X2 [Tachysurus fulvidraco]